MKRPPPPEGGGASFHEGSSPGVGFIFFFDADYFVSRGCIFSQKIIHTKKICIRNKNYFVLREAHAFFPAQTIFFLAQMRLLNFHYASCNGLDNLHKTSTRPMIQYHKNTNLSRWTIKACVYT